MSVRGWEGTCGSCSRHKESFRGYRGRKSNGGGRKKGWKTKLVHKTLGLY